MASELGRELGRAPSPTFWNGKRVLLTGHTGFKGSWLAFWLKRLGAEVTGLALPPEPGSLAEQARVDEHVAAVHADIRDRDAVTRTVATASPDIVLHLAAQALVRASYADPVGTFATNVMGTAHVLEAVRHESAARAVICVTSDKCYENREWNWPYRETDALGGYDPYSASKAATELTAAAWRRSYAASPSCAAIATARAGNVIGGGDWSHERLVPDCIRAFSSRRTVEIRSPRATRPWQHVLEPLLGYLMLAEAVWHRRAEMAQAWNFGPVMEDVQPVGTVVDQLAAIWGDGASWRSTEIEGPHEAGLLAVDPALARAKLGWRPRMRLSQALEWTGSFYRDYLAGQDAAALVDAQITQYEAIGSHQ